MSIGFPKPRKGSRRREKDKVARAEGIIIGSVRERCVERDGYCRLQGVARFGPCDGRSTWAHLGDRKRAHTVGEAPEDRHTTAGSLMLCQGHHQTGQFAYDLNRMEIEPLDAEKGADGRLKFWSPGRAYYVEAA